MWLRGRIFRATVKLFENGDEVWRSHLYFFFFAILAPLLVHLKGSKPATLFIVAAFAYVIFAGINFAEAQFAFGKPLGGAERIPTILLRCIVGIYLSFTG